MMKKILASIMLLFAFASFAQGINDYLIQHDIGVNRYRPKRTTEMFGNSGSLISEDHFEPDHNDSTYGARYVHPLTLLGSQVEVTQHAGSDSDKWLLHEIEESYQQPNALGAAYAAPNPLRDIDGNKVFFMWGNYEWVSGSIVVSISFSDPNGSKPEPLEVVQAYLQKYPSTIPATLVLDDAHKIQWIKDEMDRRLWLCDKWFMQLQLKKAEEKDVYREVVESMNIFLDYREKYFSSFFSSFKAAPEKNLLEQLLAQSNGTGIRRKLKEYKDWWAGNKNRSISL